MPAPLGPRRSAFSPGARAKETEAGVSRSRPGWRWLTASTERLSGSTATLEDRHRAQGEGEGVVRDLGGPRAPAGKTGDAALEAAQLEGVGDLVRAVERAVQDAREEGGGGAAEVPGTVVAAPCREGVVGVARLLAHPGRWRPRMTRKATAARQAEALQGGDDAAPARDGAEHHGRGRDGQPAQSDVEHGAGGERKQEQEDREGGQEGQQPQGEGAGPHAGEGRLESERAEGERRPARRGEPGSTRQERHEERGARVGSHSPDGRRARRV